jgi:hypothetical protein
VKARGRQTNGTAGKTEGIAGYLRVGRGLMLDHRNFFDDRR